MIDFLYEIRILKKIFLLFKVDLDEKNLGNSVFVVNDLIMFFIVLVLSLKILFEI